MLSCRLLLLPNGLGSLDSAHFYWAWRLLSHGLRLTEEELAMIKGGEIALLKIKSG